MSLYDREDPQHQAYADYWKHMMPMPKPLERGGMTDVERVMARTGMSEMQAINHLKQREKLRLRSRHRSTGAGS